ncbi:MAG: ribonuclease III [Clostridia bacterium]|nr:ribonuclease III [Clostridia bacterium]
MLEKLEQSIGYNFKDKGLLKKALTHKSYANEVNIESNEKFEFLGDSILEFISSKYLYDNLPNLKEGEMTKVRAEVVCEKSLYKIALRHNFSDFLYVGRSERYNGGNKRPAILADSVEAVIAAIYFDAGLDMAEKFIIENLREEIKLSSKNVGMKDFKTVLQEKVQVNKENKIEYKLLREDGPDHNKTFTVCVEINGKRIAEGTGHTKKKAEMEAAKKTLEILK